jgi:hypothetical protein
MGLIIIGCARLRRSYIQIKNFLNSYRAGAHSNSVTLDVSALFSAGDRCYQFRISTCTVFISESVVAPLLTPATGARRRQQSLPAECGQLHCPGHGSNPDRGKCDFFFSCTLKQIKVYYNKKN